MASFILGNSYTCISHIDHFASSSTTVSFFSWFIVFISKKSGLPFLTASPLFYSPIYIFWFLSLHIYNEAPPTSLSKWHYNSSLYLFWWHFFFFQWWGLVVDYSYSSLFLSLGEILIDDKVAPADFQFIILLNQLSRVLGLYHHSEFIKIFRYPFIQWWTSKLIP